ncbi:MAG: tRNA1(Val) (adenine(37)-N6)-methyltransferase [Thermodesulfobacteriota bacterium]
MKRLTSGDEEDSADFTADTFFEGRIRVRQHRRGYRFSIDSVLLADHAAGCRAGAVLDLGAGCGIIPLILAYRNPEARILGVEIQRDLARIARDNVARNRLAERITILQRDFRTLERSDSNLAGVLPADLVVSNPPYRRVRSGRMNPDPRKAVARHEIAAELRDVVSAARRMLEISGRFLVVHLAERTADLLCEMRTAGIEPKFLRMIHSRVGEPAQRILAEGKKGGRPGLRIAPPLVIYQPDGEYTPEVNRMFLP